MNRMKALKDGLVKGLMAVAGKFAGLAQRIELGRRAPAYLAWVRDRGDFTRRLDYPLTSAAIVWDVGGYEGQWTSDIFARFGCRVHVFEPDPAAAESIRRRFAANPLVAVHAFALGEADGRRSLSVAADASSLEPDNRGLDTQAVDVRDMIAVWRELGGARVDLLKLNIEGGEYALLERLVESGLMAEVGELQVQFHDFVPQAEARRQALAAQLARTHERTWCYEFVWENWRRRPARTA
jgi:FkbM family methyltransferase